MSLSEGDCTECHKSLALPFYSLQVGPGSRPLAAPACSQSAYHIVTKTFN